MSYVTIRDGEIEKWDPFAHPRDENGRFIKLPNNVYKYGKSKTARYRVMGRESTTMAINLDPGDILWKTPIGNFFVQKSDGSYMWYGIGTKPPRTVPNFKPPAGSVIVEKAKAITVKASNLQEAANKVDQEIGKEPKVPVTTQRQQEELRARQSV